MCHVTGSESQIMEVQTRTESRASFRFKKRNEKQTKNRNLCQSCIVLFISVVYLEGGRVEKGRRADHTVGRMMYYYYRRGISDCGWKDEEREEGM